MKSNSSETTDSRWQKRPWQTLSVMSNLEIIMPESGCGASSFGKGDPKTKKEILKTMGSNLILKDKKLLIEAKKPFFILGNALSPEKPVIPPIEPENNKAAQGRKVPSIFLRPYLLADLDDVRTSLRKAKRVATLIYAHFKKEFGTPVRG